MVIEIPCKKPVSEEVTIKFVPINKTCPGCGLSYRMKNDEIRRLAGKLHDGLLNREDSSMRFYNAMGWIFRSPLSEVHEDLGDYD